MYRAELEDLRKKNVEQQLEDIRKSYHEYNFH